MLSLQSWCSSVIRISISEVDLKIQVETCPVVRHRFAVLVAGTLVYGKGDEKGAKEELAHAVTEALAAQPTAATDGEPALVTTTSVPVTSRPIAVSYMQTSSLKATRNILSGSYSRSFSRSLPRSALGGGGTYLQTDSPAARL